MDTSAPATITRPDTIGSFALSLLSLRKLPDVVDFLYTFQQDLNFLSLHLALPREDRKHLRVERPKPESRLFIQVNSPVEERVFAEAGKVIMEGRYGEVRVGLPLRVKGRLNAALVVTFTHAAAVVPAVAWFEARCEALALSVEQTWQYSLLEKQLREKAMQLVVMQALTSERDYGQMFLTITAAIHTLVPCEFLTIPAFSDQTGFLISGYSAIRQPEGFVLLNREEMLDLLGLDLETYREAARSQMSVYYTPRIFSAEEYARLGEKLIISNRVIHALGMKEAMFIPIRLQAGAVATLVLCSRRENAFAPKDLQMLTELANQISGLIERLLHFEQKEILEIRLRRENSLLIQELNNDRTLAEIVGSSPALRRVLDDVHKVAPTDSTVLIGGETGTGKELIARAVHHLSPRRKRPLIKVNCAALPAQLIESELFGHEKGAFTGATERRIGKFELANGGTIFLDEIGELPLELQSKLLRVLQEKEIERIGGKQTIRLDIRVIAATNRNLQQEATEGRFRTDLYYRLNTFPLHLPPLRERSEDIPLLARHFAEQYARKLGKTVQGLGPDLMQYLRQHHWPGNIRELEHVIEQAVILATDTQLGLPSHFATAGALPIHGQVPPRETPEQSINHRLANLDEIELAFLESQRQHILEVLQETGGRIRGRFGAAQRLGLKPTTLEARMKKLGIRRNFGVE